MNNTARWTFSKIPHQDIWDEAQCASVKAINEYDEIHTGSTNLYKMMFVLINIENTKFVEFLKNSDFEVGYNTSDSGKPYLYIFFEEFMPKTFRFKYQHNIEARAAARKAFTNILNNYGITTVL